MPWAARSAQSAGRIHAEPEHEFRSAYQRDRDRIVHSTAFRRLQGKTQVFIYDEGDHFRNRLTHTLEGAQIARTVARALGCNEDLTEAIVLAHDLGHTPFGHAGERVVFELLEEHGGFEHNRQGLRIVDWTEHRRAEYRGLNLTQETRAGILKHGAEYPNYSHPVEMPTLGKCPTAEAQIANLADDIAYNNHDIDDGLRSGILTEDELSDVQLWRLALERTPKDAPASRVIVALIDLLASDLMHHSQMALSESGVRSSDEVVQAPVRLIAFSPAIASAVGELADFLMSRLYRHPQVAQMGDKARRILRDLWTAYTEDPRLLPPHVLEGAPGEPTERAIADYLTGMTDRFAIDEHLLIGLSAS